MLLSCCDAPIWKRYKFVTSSENNHGGVRQFLMAVIWLTRYSVDMWYLVIFGYVGAVMTHSSRSHSYLVDRSLSQFFLTVYVIHLGNALGLAAPGWLLLHCTEERFST